MSTALDATAFGLSPLKSGCENSAALQAAIDEAYLQDGGTITISAGDTYEISGVIVRTPPSGTLTIEGLYGNVQLMCSDGAVFLVERPETSTAGGVVLRNLTLGGFSSVEAM